MLPKTDKVHETEVKSETNLLSEILSRILEIKMGELKEAETNLANA